MAAKDDISSNNKNTSLSDRLRCVYKDLNIPQCQIVSKSQADSNSHNNNLLLTILQSHLN